MKRVKHCWVTNKGDGACLLGMWSSLIEPRSKVISLVVRDMWGDVCNPFRPSLASDLICLNSEATAEEINEVLEILEAPFRATHEGTWIAIQSISNSDIVDIVVCEEVALC